MRQWRPKLLEAGVQELVFEDAQDMVIDQLNSLGTPDALTVPVLEANMRDPGVSPMVVMYLRLLTSVEIGRREDFFGPFILVGLICAPEGLMPLCPSSTISGGLLGMLTGAAMPCETLHSCVITSCYKA